MPDEIHISPANPHWPARFAEEKARLLAAHGGRFVAVEHFGSTAVPGLPAKPVIDMLGGVRSMAEADALLPLLCADGWDTSPEFNATLTDRRFLLRWPGGVRTHHLHLVVHGGETWTRRLQFRDTLRARPDLAREYAALKHDLAARFAGDREAYTAAKGGFVARVLAVETNILSP